MSDSRRFSLRGSGLFVLLFAVSGTVQAQVGYGVNASGDLFRFNITDPGPIPTTPLGNLGIVPEGIDFRPGTSTLYAIDVGQVTTQLYTVNISNGSVTAVGAGFPSMGANYDLTGNQGFGFDFNPSTLQADNSMRIRLVSTASENLRLHSATGQIAAVDTDLLIPPSDSPFVDGAAYLNNIPNTATIPTTLYDIDTRNDGLYTQAPPNNGQLNLVGTLVGDDVSRGVGFDIYTDPNDADPGIGGDAAYAVLKRDATAGGAYLLYQVDLATGAISNGKLVGNPNADFTGGFAIAPIPEPASLAWLSGLLLMWGIRRSFQV